MVWASDPSVSWMLKCPLKCLKRQIDPEHIEEIIYHMWLGKPLGGAGKSCRGKGCLND